MILLFLLSLTISSCVPYKPELDNTQVVEGASIIVPPEFNQLPKEN